MSVCRDAYQQRLSARIHDLTSLTPSAHEYMLTGQTTTVLGLFKALFISCGDRNNDDDDDDEHAAVL